MNIPEPHCLRRSFNLTSEMPGNWTSEVVKRIMDYPDYINFWNNSERMYIFLSWRATWTQGIPNIGIPHDHIHRAIGGDIRRQYSPNEPLVCAPPPYFATLSRSHPWFSSLSTTLRLTVFGHIGKAVTRLASGTMEEIPFRMCLRTLPL
jgi:hypothetical protein